MPVLDHVGPARHVGPRLQPQLPVERRVLALRVPADRLRVRLGDEVGRALHRAGEVAHERDPPAVEPLLRVVVRVDGGDVEELRDLLRVDRGAGRAVEVLGDPLAGGDVLPQDPRLPAEEVGHQRALVALPLELPAGVQDAVARRQLVPAPEELAPVDEAPGLVERVHRPELPLQPLLEAGLHVRPGGAVGPRLVVDLPADDARVLRVALGDLPDDALAVLPVDRVRDVHVLAHPVELARACGPARGGSTITSGCFA